MSPGPLLPPPLPISSVDRPSLTANANAGNAGNAGNANAGNANGTSSLKSNSQLMKKRKEVTKSNMPKSRSVGSYLNQNDSPMTGSGTGAKNTGRGGVGNIDLFPVGENLRLSDILLRTTSVRKDANRRSTLALTRMLFCFCTLS